MKSLPVGAKYGKLTVIGVGDVYVQPNMDRHASSIVECECGQTRTVTNRHLKNGHTKSCGCRVTDVLIKRNTTHNLSRTPEYCSWNCMITRVTNETREKYANHGGRGIAICERWRHSFENFIADMGQKTTHKHTLDRIDNEGNYSCGKCGQCVANGWTANCRWATPLEQANNQRKNVRLTFYGKEMTLAEWSRISQVASSTISLRLKRGWTEKSAVWTPQARRSRR